MKQGVAVAGFEPVGDVAIAAGIREFLLEWVWSRTDWHAYEDYTEMYPEVGSPYAEPGSERLVMYQVRPRVLLVVRPRVDGGVLVLESFTEGGYGFVRNGSARYDLADPRQLEWLGPQLLRWSRGNYE